MDGGAWWPAVHGVAESRAWLNNFTCTFHFHALEKEMATHASILAWRIQGMGEPVGLPSMGSYVPLGLRNPSYWRAFLEICQVFFCNAQTRLQFRQEDPSPDLVVYGSQAPDHQLWWFVTFRLVVWLGLTVPSGLVSLSLALDPRGLWSPFFLSRVYSYSLWFDGIFPGLWMSPRSRRTVWQDDCSFWPEQNFFHRITWDWTTKMVWFWVIPHSPLYLSLVGVCVGACTCNVAPEFIASEDSGKGSNHPLSCRILSPGIQGNDLPPSASSVPKSGSRGLSSPRAFQTTAPLKQQVFWINVLSELPLEWCGDIEFSRLS